MLRGHVVVVEDEIEVAATLLELLVGRDCEVRTATTAQEGLDVITAFRPDVLLLDISLPGFSGVDLMSVLARVHPALPVIVVSSTIDPRVIDRIARLAPVDFVQKPYDIDRLDKLIASAIEERHGSAGA